VNTESLYHSEWFEVVKTDDNYEYVIGKDTVYFVPFKFSFNQKEDKRSVQFLIRQEYTPHLGLVIRPASGTVEESDESVFTRAIKEVKEECGFDVSQDRVKFVACLNSFLDVSKKNYLVLIDVTGLEQSEPLTDGSTYEENSLNLWIDYFNIKTILINSNSLELIGILSLVYFIFEDTINEMDQHNTD